MKDTEAIEILNDFIALSGTDLDLKATAFEAVNRLIDRIVGLQPYDWEEHSMALLKLKRGDTT